tara:strand:- start:29 stop:424 length:396 start_codon:yes stop_codon:yes gene_type:complete
MASELRVNTLKDASGNNSVATSVVFNGSAKAWVNFTGVSSTSPRDSFNVASLTDSGTGHTTVTFTNAMSNANYTGSWFTNSDASSGITNLSNNYAGNFAVRATGSYQTQCWATNGGADAFHNDSTIHGDLA